MRNQRTRPERGEREEIFSLRRSPKLNTRSWSNRVRVCVCQTLTKPNSSAEVAPIRPDALRRCKASQTKKRQCVAHQQRAANPRKHKHFRAIQVNPNTLLCRAQSVYRSMKTEHRVNPNAWRYPRRAFTST